MKVLFTGFSIKSFYSTYGNTLRSLMIFFRIVQLLRTSLVIVINHVLALAEPSYRSFFEALIPIVIDSTNGLTGKK